MATRTHLEGQLAQLLSENFLHKHRHRPHPSEVRSWERSIPALTNALVEAGLGDVEMLLEYGLPLTSKRAGVILVGVHPTTGGSSYLMVELKQWSNAYLRTVIRCDAASTRTRGPS